MQVVKSTPEDLPKIMEIVDHAQKYLANLGIDQWQNGYPDEKIILSDIENENAFLLKDEHKNTLATTMFTTKAEKSYNSINGQWLTENDATYGVIHRMAVHNDFRKNGAARFLFVYFEKQLINKKVKSMRIDTHEDNLGMQKLLKLSGYEYCGVIYLEDGGKRLAFEKLLNF